MAHCDVIEPGSYLAERDIEERWPMLRPGEMRRARKADLIEWFAFPTGPHYTAEAVQQYIDRKYRRKPTWHAKQQDPEQAPSSPREIVPPSVGSTEASTSTPLTPTAAASTTPAGMTPELAMFVAEASAQRIAMKRGRHSSRSSRPSRRGQPTNALSLVKS